MSKEKQKNKNHTSHFALHTSNNGITLIALIITIIVMLILTGVTLSVTLGDNGLVNKAKEATLQTQIAMDRELLLSAVVGAIEEDGKVNLSAIVLPEGFTGSNGTYTSKNGHTFTVSTNGEITYTGENAGGGDAPSEDEPVGFNWESVGLNNIEANTEYLAAENGITLFFEENGTVELFYAGIIMAEIDATNSDNIKDGKINCLSYVDGVDTIVRLEMNENNIDVDTTMIYIDEDGNEDEPWTFTCKKTIVDNETIYSNKDVLTTLGITNNTGTYKGTWTKIGTDENGNAKLASTSAVANCTLGYRDINAIEAVTIEGTEPTEAEKLERSIWSYKNALNTLNTTAQEATGIINARSIKIEDIYDIIGEENINKGTEYGKVYKYYYNTETGTVFSKYKTGDNTWSEPYNTNNSREIFVNDNGETVVIESEGDEVIFTDSFYTFDSEDELKSKIEPLASGTYWLASYCVYGSAGFFHMRMMECGYMTYQEIFDSSGYGYSTSRGVHAVVSVPDL